MNAFFLVDKPLEITSFWVLSQIRKKLGIRKIWHTGTLDPLATGCLLVATWGYTKLIPYFEKSTKEYEFTVSLDGETESFDLWEPVKFLSKKLQEEYRKEIKKEDIEKILQEKFLWKITQIPPKYSALKIWWKRACDLVREWKNIKMKLRKTTIYSIKLLEFNYPNVSIIASVDAGTYIRSIASDLWKILWTGGYITKLRRTKIWNLDISLSENLEKLTLEKQLGITNIFNTKNFISLDEAILEKINNGLKIYEKFPYKIWEDLFIEKNGIITNIIRYDWEKLFPVRKI